MCGIIGTIIMVKSINHLLQFYQVSGLCVIPGMLLYGMVSGAATIVVRRGAGWNLKTVLSAPRITTFTQNAIEHYE